MSTSAEKLAKVLSSQGRKHIKAKNFALPGERYPIHDEAHARNALARVAQHGTPAEQAQVRAAVQQKFPGIEQASEKTAELTETQGAALGGLAAGGLSLAMLPRMRAKRKALLQQASRLQTMRHYLPGARLYTQAPEGLRAQASDLTQYMVQTPIAATGAGSLLGGAMASGGSEKVSMSFLAQDRPESVKKIYKALKREHPEMSAEMKARIAARQGKPGKQHQGPPYRGALSEDAGSEKKAYVPLGLGALAGSMSADKDRRLEGAGAGAIGGDLVLAPVGYGAGTVLGGALASRKVRESMGKAKWSEPFTSAARNRALTEARRIKTLSREGGAIAAALLGGVLGQKVLSPRKEKKASLTKLAFLQGDPQATAVAQQRMVEIWARLVILYLLYWDGHWKSSGPQQNADHDLFRRLYHDTLKPIDDIAEKIHGYFGNGGFSLPQAMQMVSEGLAELYARGEDHVQMGLLAEDYFQAHLRQTHAELGKLGVMPLGLDDWLMATASDFETHTYLLQQRAAQPASVKTASTASRHSVKTASHRLGSYLQHFQNVRGKNVMPKPVK